MNGVLNQFGNISPVRKGIKIVDDNTNKRVSDIFNTKNKSEYSNANYNRNNKVRIIEVTEQIIESKMRVNFFNNKIEFFSIYERE
jgi:hypothetical protein